MNMIKKLNNKILAYYLRKNRIPCLERSDFLFFNFVSWSLFGIIAIIIFLEGHSVVQYPYCLTFFIPFLTFKFLMWLTEVQETSTLYEFLDHIVPGRDNRERELRVSLVKDKFPRLSRIKSYNYEEESSPNHEDVVEWFSSIAKGRSFEYLLYRFCEKDSLKNK